MIFWFLQENDICLLRLLVAKSQIRFYDTLLALADVMEGDFIEISHQTHFPGILRGKIDGDFNLLVREIGTGIDFCVDGFHRVRPHEAFLHLPMRLRNLHPLLVFQILADNA